MTETLLPIKKIKVIKRLNDHVDERKVFSLVNYIKDNGITGSLQVRRDGKRFELIEGYLLLHAARIMGIDEIPATILD